MSGHQVLAVHFGDFVNGYNYLLYFLASVCAGALAAIWVPLNEEARDRLINIYAGLLAAQGIIASFAMSESETMLQMISRQTETEINFLDVYLSYRRSLLSLMMQTYYDYENEISLIDKYRPTS